MYIYKYIRRFGLITVLIMMIICCVGCGEKASDTEETKKEIIKTYSISADEALSEEKIDTLVDVLADRVSYYDVKGKVSLKDQDEN